MNRWWLPLSSHKSGLIFLVWLLALPCFALQGVGDAPMDQTLFFQQSENGLIWWGKQSGVYLYDGLQASQIWSPEEDNQLLDGLSDGPALLIATARGLTRLEIQHGQSQTQQIQAVTGIRMLAKGPMGKLHLAGDFGVFHLSPDNEPTWLHQAPVQRLAFHQGQAWIVSEEGVLMRRLAAAGRFVAMEDPENLLRDLQVQQLVEADKEHLALLAQNKLLHFNTVTGSLSPKETEHPIHALIPTEDGCLALDQQGRLLRTVRGTMEPIGRVANLEATLAPTTSLPSFTDRNGLLWLGIGDGYRHHKLVVNQPELPLTLYAARLNGQDISEGPWRPQADDLIQLHFGFPSYDDADQHSYAFKLEGANDDWITLGPNRRLNLTAPGPGTYDLVLAGTHRGERFQLRFPIQVSGPPTSLVAWLLFPLLAALLLVGLFMRRQARTLREEHTALVKLQKDNAALRQTDQRRDQLLADTTHELRTPLNGMVGIAEALASGSLGPVSDEQKRNLDLIISGGVGLAMTVNDILDFARLHENKINLDRTAFFLAPLIQRILGLHQPLLRGKELRLVTELPPELPAVSADENRVAQILHNLVGNAVKFTEQGTVTVSAEARDTFIWISVEDTGSGIDPEMVEHIFERFQQGQEMNKGLGLGLSITRELVRLHGGDIKAEPRAQEGTRFTFSLPIAKEAPRESAQTNHPGQSSFLIPDPTPVQHASGCIEILLVDDEPINLQVLANFLEPEKHRLTAANSGKGALSLLKERRFDLILLDIMMPHMSGFEVCRRVRETYAPEELPIVMLTARYQVSDVVRAYEVGANDYLVKPVSRDELMIRINTHLKLMNISRQLQETTQRLEEAGRKMEERLHSRTLEIQERNQELETLNDIVKTINEEVSLPRLLRSLVEEALNLVPDAENGFFLIRDPEQDLFRFAVIQGYDLPHAEVLGFSEEDIKQRFKVTDASEKAGVHIAVFSDEDQDKHFHEHLPRPACSLIMAVRVRDAVEGVLILDKQTLGAEAFGDAELDRMDRLRAHAVSAVAKARMLEQMRLKNQELVDRRRKMIMQEKMAYLTTLTTGIAHEIQNPLNFVNNFAAVAVDMSRELHETLRKSRKKMLGNTYDQVREILEDLEENAGMIYQYGKRADRIVRSMMIHNQEGLQDRRPTNLNAMLDEQYELVYHAVYAFGDRLHIDLIREYDPAAELIEVVPQDIGRALLNLLSNALYAIDEKYVRQGPDYKPTLRLATAVTDETLTIEVEDNGPGIKAEHQDRVFTPFFTTKPSGKGIGLGLSICFHIVVEGHGGELRLESEEGTYTRFIINLPREDRRKSLQDPQAED